MKKTIISTVALLSLLITPIALAQSYYTTGSCVSVPAGLSIGSRASGVLQLQAFLVAQNYPGGGSWMETGYFGAATQAALRDFQSQHGLPQTGFVDAATASAINGSCGGSSYYPSTYYPNTSLPYSYTTPAYPYSNYYGGAPTITTLSQNTGTTGTVVTIYGVGFDPYNNAVNFGGTVLSGIPSNNGTSLSFTVPSNYYAYSLSGTSVQLSVSDSRGTSNSVSFTVWGSPSTCGSYGYNYTYPYNNNCGVCNYSYGSNAYCPQPVQTTSPSISYITPNSGGVGTVVTIYGSGFSATGNSVDFGPGVIPGLLSSNGTSLSFTVPSSLTGYGNQPITLSTYNVSVTNGYGVSSNRVPFTVTSTNNSGQPTIGSVNGPNSLSTGQQGTWTLVVNSSGNQYLTVSASWGDQGYAGAQPTTQSQYYANQTITLTHTYYQSGTYSITFTVSNGSQSNTYTTTVSVGGSVNGGISISQLAPNAGAVGQAVTVYGSGFTNTNTVLFGGGALQNVYSGSGVSLTFTVPSSVAPYCAPGTACPQYVQQITPGTYNVSVMNQNGATSNTLPFTVN